MDPLSLTIGAVAGVALSLLTLKVLQGKDAAALKTTLTILNNLPPETKQYVLRRVGEVAEIAVDQFNTRMKEAPNGHNQ